jgi:hypothetical protein
VTFYINLLMSKLFKHVNCPANFFSAFDKPCIPLKTSMKSMFMSRNGHDKSMTKMYGNGLMFWVKEWTFKPRNGLCCLGMVWYYIHCYVFQLVCQYDDIPLASLYTSERKYAYSISMSGNVNTLVYFYVAVCTSVFIP